MGKVKRDLELKIQEESRKGLRDWQIAEKLNIPLVTVVKVLNPNY